MWLSVHRYHKLFDQSPAPHAPSPLLINNQPTTQKVSCPLKGKFPFANGVLLALFCPLGQDESGPVRGISLRTYHLLFGKISHQHLKYNCAMCHQPHCLAFHKEDRGIRTCAWLCAIQGPSHSRLLLTGGLSPASSPPGASHLWP